MQHHHKDEQQLNIVANTDEANLHTKSNFQQLYFKTIDFKTSLSLLTTTVTAKLNNGFCSVSKKFEINSRLINDVTKQKHLFVYLITHCNKKPIHSLALYSLEKF